MITKGVESERNASKGKQAVDPTPHAGDHELAAILGVAALSSLLPGASRVALVADRAARAGELRKQRWRCCPFCHEEHKESIDHASTHCNCAGHPLAFLDPYRAAVLKYSSLLNSFRRQKKAAHLRCRLKP